MNLLSVESKTMSHSKSKKPSPGSNDATPNEAQPEAALTKNTFTSVLERKREKMRHIFSNDQDRSIYKAMGIMQFGLIDAFVPQVYVGSHALDSIVHANLPSLPKYYHPNLHSIRPDPPPNPRFFSQNVAPPTLSTSLPPPGVGFENTTQLAYCGNVLRKYFSPSSAAASPSDESLDATQRALIKLYAQSDNEANRVRWLIQRVVEEFAANSLKTAADLSEVLLLVHSLDQESYRKLLSCMIAQFKSTKLLDIDLLQGLVYLVESTSSDYLELDDFVHILVVLRTHLQEKHQQSTKYPYYLTLALSRLLDVMVEGKVKDLRRFVDQEPLSILFSQLKDSEDSYLKHQATYALQSLLHVPNDETHRQFVLQHTGNVTMGLLGVVSVCKLDLGQFMDGADHLYEVAGEGHESSTEM
ncbi:hypothetical protein BGZ95_000703, partial [Linnemannia exigua]